MTVEIKVFDFRQGLETEYAAYNRLRNEVGKERLPDDPPVSLEETTQSFQNAPPDSAFRIRFWAAWTPDGEMVGYGLIQMSMKDNLHLANFNINVRRDFRRKGIGRRLLARVVAEAKDEGRRVLIASTMASVPAGEAFLARIGAERKLAAHTNQLRMDELDAALLDNWCERARQRASDFSLGWWFGEYPGADIRSIESLWQLLNQQPFDGLDVEDVTYSEEVIRHIERSLFARGFERWSLYARHVPTGEFAGYTEMLWHPDRPEIMQQEMTGVFEKFRGKGLGSWLKATMLRKVITDRPQVRFIRTENADSNKPMLKINEALGFKPYIAETVWQMEREQAEAYLSA